MQEEMQHIHFICQRKTFKCVTVSFQMDLASMLSLLSFHHVADRIATFTLSYPN